MKRSTYQKRIARLRERIEGIAPDAVWILEPETRRYFSGFKAQDGQINESSGSLIISAEAACLITDSRYAAEARREAPDFEVILFRQDFAETLADLLDRIGVGNLGFQEDFLAWGLHARLRRRLRKVPRTVRITPLKGLPERMREVKDEAEIRAMAAASDLMSRVLARVIEGLEPGVTEKQVAWLIEGLAREGGADSLAFPSIVASGPNAALPHAVPTDRRIRAREPVILDVGLKWKGYCCDMTRTIFLGDPRPKFKKIYRTVREAQLRALETLRPGVKSTVPDRAARDLITAAGFGSYFGHALGHGVGLDTHEGPRLGPANPVRLERGMVVTVEPGIYIPGQGGVRLEHMVVLEDKGPRILTRDDHFYDF
ncbi:MAG: aminopeptidase P family protein [Deltaproteobacteria bacterium]|nr:aminopeptidase P family protein [Deltaproteobacteria bacterium]